MRRLPSLLALILLVGCEPSAQTVRGTPAALNEICSQGERAFSVRDVVVWAQLDDYFRDRTLPVEVGAADGKAVLGRLVLLENGREAADFLKAHGCSQFSGPTAVRQLPRALEVEVELVGKDGAKMILLLRADGSPQGEG